MARPSPFRWPMVYRTAPLWVPTFSADVEEIARRIVFAGEVLHKAGVVAIGHEADVLTVVLAGVHEVLLLAMARTSLLCSPPSGRRT